MNHKIKQFVFRYYLLMSVVSFTGVIVLSICGWLPWNAMMTIGAAIITFAFGTQKQHLEEARLFRELFDNFNKRYDQLNEQLNHIQASDAEIDQKFNESAKNTLFKYFNLCGEEHFYMSLGYIYPEVWRSWRNGMDTFRNNRRIKRLWDEEIQTGSYYGLRFD
jgi:hypothetical protein